MTTLEYKVAQQSLNQMYADGRIGPLEYTLRLRALNKVYYGK